MKSEVSIVKCGSYDFSELDKKIRESLELIGGIKKFIKPNSKVLVKPNLLMAVGPEANITTHPEFVRSVVRILKEIGCKIYLGDSPSVFGGEVEDVFKVYEQTGMKKLSEEENMELVVFDKRFIQGYFPLTTWVKECDFIVNLPKFKTHDYMILTAAVKNLFGLIPGTFKMEAHKNFYKPEKFAELLLDIHSAKKPAVSILDGIWGIEGNGPATSGIRRDFGLILASSDSVSLDCVLAELINISPDKIFTNKAARLRNIESAELSNIEIKGESISSSRIPDFKLPETSLKQTIETKLPAPIINTLKKFIYFHPKIDSDICRLCESCIKNCPQKTIYKKNEKIVIDYSKCISCFCCREVCPYAAVGTKKSLLVKLMRM